MSILFWKYNKIIKYIVLYSLDHKNQQYIEWYDHQRENDVKY